MQLDQLRLCEEIIQILYMYACMYVCMYVWLCEYVLCVNIHALSVNFDQLWLCEEVIQILFMYVCMYVYFCICMDLALSLCHRRMYKGIV